MWDRTLQPTCPSGCSLLWRPQWLPAACTASVGAASRLQHSSSLSNLSPVTSVPSVPWAPISTPFPLPMHISPSDHLSRPNSNPAFSLSLSNYARHPHSSCVVTSPSLKSCLSYNMCSTLAFSGIVPYLMFQICLPFPLLDSMSLKSMVYFSYICQSTITLGFQ